MKTRRPIATGGRWNPPGRSCVYTAKSRALAVLEMLVHLCGRGRGLPYRLLTVEIPDDSILRARFLPGSWNRTPPGEASQSIGGDWLEAGRSVAMEVPSAIIPAESNFLLNPLASGFHRVAVVDNRRFQLDLRPGSPESTGRPGERSAVQ